VLTKRIIACMDVRDGQVVKGVQFQQLRHAGDPAELAQRYNVEGIDEVVVLDITATLESRQALARTISAVAHRIFLPLTVGGGIRKEDDAAAAVDAGADKVSLNTAALSNPALITTLARRYGSQAVIVAIDAKRRGDGFAVYVRSGTSDAATPPPLPESSAASAPSSVSAIATRPSCATTTRLSSGIRPPCARRYNGCT